VRHTWGLKEKYSEFEVGKPEGRRQFGTRGCVWEDNIKTDLQEME
jgi:hypothetical protein